MSRLLSMPVLLDPDGDGYMTAEEYICNNDPTNALSFLELAPTPSNLVFQTAENRSDAVESCSDLVSNDWKNVSGSFPTVGTPVVVPVAATSAAAFYRVRVSLP